MVGRKLHNPGRAGILRRAAAGFYDWMLVIALMMTVSLFFVAPNNEAIAAGNRGYQTLLVSIIGMYFVGFWAYRGQTLGMRAWHLRLENTRGGTASKKQCILRLVYALVGLLPLAMGFWWQQFDRDGLSWHDRWSHTRIRRVMPDKARSAA